MRHLPLTSALLAVLLAIGVHCEKPCKAPADEAERAAQCETHPFGRAPGCGGVEEPQTFGACMQVLRANPGICASDYVACRDAIRVVPCDVCPPECEDVAGACTP